MVSQISLQKIIDADWSKQYLTSAGTVESRGFCSRIVTFLRQAPYIGGLFAAFLPKPDIFKASDAIKREIKQLIANGKDVDDSDITAAAAKINELVYKIANKQPQKAESWNAALINVRDLIVVQPRVEIVIDAEEPAEQPAPEATQANVVIDDQQAAAVNAQPEDANQLPDIIVLDDLEPAQQPAPQDAEALDVQANDAQVQDAQVQDMQIQDMQIQVVEVEEQEVEPAAPQLSVEEFPTPAEAQQAQKLSGRLAVEEKKRRHKDKKPKAAKVVNVQDAQIQQPVAQAPKKKHANKKI